MDGVVISVHCLNSPACMALCLFLCLTSRGFTWKWKISKVMLQIRFVLFLEPSLWNNYWKKEPLFFFWEHLCSLSLCVLFAFWFLKMKPFWSLLIFVDLWSLMGSHIIPHIRTLVWLVEPLSSSLQLFTPPDSPHPILPVWLSESVVTGISLMSLWRVICQSSLCSYFCTDGVF